MEFSPFFLLGGLLLGWSIGGMDFSVLFGPAIYSKMVRYWRGVLLASLFCFLGAFLQGHNGISTIASLTVQTAQTALFSSVCAAIVIIVLNLLRLPVPTSQAVVGSIVGIALVNGTLYTQPLVKVVICWLSAPVFSFLISIPLYLGVGKIYNQLSLNIFQRDSFLRVGLIIGGCYASYSLGANSVANVAAVFTASGSLSVIAASIIGAAAIILGFVTFSKRVVSTVGAGIIKLNAYSALIAVFCEAITTHTFAIIGVPVSMTQALIGAMIGIGFLRDYRTIRIRNVKQIFLFWILTPLFSALISGGLYHCFINYFN